MKNIRIEAVIPDALWSQLMLIQTEKEFTENVKQGLEAGSLIQDVIVKVFEKGEVH